MGTSTTTTIEHTCDRCGTKDAPSFVGASLPVPAIDPPSEVEGYVRGTHFAREFRVWCAACATAIADFAATPPS